MKNELRITKMPRKTWHELQNISKHLGIPVAQFLKPALREIADSYNEEMKSDSIVEVQKITISGFSRKIKKDLQNISKKHGIDLSTFLKPKIYEIVKSKPDWMKKDFIPQ